MKQPGAKSKYQRKLARKAGKGKVSANWMWWMERPAVRAAQKAAA